MGLMSCYTEIHGDDTENELATIITGKVIEIHLMLGLDLLESAYQACLERLLESGPFVEKEKPLPVTYKEVKLEQDYRLDLLVEQKVVIELKTVETLTDVHTAQLLTYLKLSGYQLGLLINFNVKILRDGVKRLASFPL